MRKTTQMFDGFPILVAENEIIWLVVVSTIALAFEIDLDTRLTDNITLARLALHMEDGPPAVFCDVNAVISPFEVSSLPLPHSAVGHDHHIVADQLALTHAMDCLCARNPPRHEGL
jgi:hypothetical protein